MTESFADIGDVDAEATLWLARLHADSRDAEDEYAFRRWLTAGPANAEAFRHATMIWDAAGGVSPDRLDRGIPAPAFNRRAALAGIGSLVVAGAGLGVWNQAYAGVYQTELGEQRHFALEDGSQMFLDTDSRVRLHFDSRLRAVSLQRGRANFRVIPDLARLFVVDAGLENISARSGTFNVRRDPNRVEILLVDGDATVGAARHGQNQGDSRLRAGERLVIAPDGSPRLDMPDMAQQLAWQNGQLIADNQSLAAMATEMNRYSRTKLVIVDPQVAKLKVSGVYRVGDNAAFARSITQLLPVEVRVNGDSLEIIPVNSQSLGQSVS